MCHHVAEGLQSQQLVVPRELIGAGNAGARHVIVELMPDDALPVLREALRGIAGQSQPVGHDSRALSSVAEVFVLSVVELHGRLRRVAAVAMHVHRQFAIEDGQLGMLLIRQVVAIELVARGAEYLYGAVAGDAFLHGAHRGDGGRAANVARAIVAVDGAQRALEDFLLDGLARREVLVLPALGIVEAVGHHDAAAVDALPESDGEGVLPAAVVERIGAPLQLLRREADEPAVGSQRGQRVGKAEAVGQENVGALGVELLAVESLPEQHVAQERLRRADDDLVGIPAAAGNVPATSLDVLLHLLVLQRVVLLHPGILHAALEVEDVVRVLLQQHQVLLERVADVVADGGLHVPVPLGVEMGIGHHVGLHGFLLCANADGCKCGHGY